MGLLPEKVVSDQLAKSRMEGAQERIVRYEGYDPATLIKYGVLSWSFDEECNDESKSRLSAKLGETIGRAIFELSVIQSGEVGDSSLRSNGAESQDASLEPTPSIVSEEPSA